ncbi:hypothetical protein B0H13DRAFT_2332638 [Mycena leptocephala]|nr:hypothetical protein B0H13DRAFT_2332638 [Mycena leptocephala]
MPADDTSTNLSTPHLPITDANKHRHRTNLPTDRYLDFDKPMTTNPMLRSRCTRAKTCAFVFPTTKSPSLRRLYQPVAMLLHTTSSRFPSTTMSTSSQNDGSLRKQILAQREAEEVQIHAQEQRLSKLAVDLWVRGFQRMDEQLPATSASERPDEIARDNGIPKLHVQGHQEEGSYHLYDWMMTTFSEDPAAWVRFRRPTMESAFEHYCHTRLDLRAKNGDWVWDEEIPELVD